MKYRKQETNPEQQNEQITKLRITPDFLKNQKILMAEDILINQLLAKKIFLKWDCTIDIAYNGIVAIEKLQENEYDLVLMDIQMPEMDGHEATKYIRERLGEKSNIPIIALSAHASSIEQEKCLVSGMNGLVSKPIDEEILLEELYKWHVPKNNGSTKIIELGIKDHHDISFIGTIDEVIKSKEWGIIDYKYLNNVTKGDTRFMQELIEIVLVEIPKSLELINQYYTTEEAENLRKEAHKLKASIAIFGIEKGQKLIFDMENKIFESNSVDGLEEMVLDLNNICLELLKALRAI